MSDVTFSKKGFIWAVLILIAVIAGIGTLIYYTGYYDGENSGYQEGVQATKGILRAPEIGQIYEGVVVGKDYASKYYYELPYGKAGEKYLNEGKEGFVLVKIP